MRCSRLRVTFTTPHLPHAFTVLLYSGLVAALLRLLRLRCITRLHAFTHAWFVDVYVLVGFVGLGYTHVYVCLPHAAYTRSHTHILVLHTFDTHTHCYPIRIHVRYADCRYIRLRCYTHHTHYHFTLHTRCAVYLHYDLHTLLLHYTRCYIRWVGWLLHILLYVLRLRYTLRWVVVAPFWLHFTFALRRFAAPSRVTAPRTVCILLRVGLPGSCVLILPLPRVLHTRTFALRCSFHAGYRFCYLVFARLCRLRSVWFVWLVTAVHLFCILRFTRIYRLLFTVYRPYGSARTRTARHLHTVYTRYRQVAPRLRTVRLRILHPFRLRYLRTDDHAYAVLHHPRV